MRICNALVFVVLGATLSACPFAPKPTCRSDADCRSGGVCDPEMKVCVESSCEPSCAATQECVGGRFAGGQWTRGSCVARYAGVEVVGPVEGTVVGMGPVGVKAKLVLGEGRTGADPEKLKLVVKGPGGGTTETELMRGGEGTFEGSFTPTGEGTYELTAEYVEAGVSSGVVKVVVDGTGPSFVLVVPGAMRPGADGGTRWTDSEAGYEAAWRRDEVVRVVVTSEEPNLDTQSVRLVVRGVTDGGVGGEAQPALAVEGWGRDGGMWVGEVEVDLWKPQMRAFRGEFGLKVEGKDQAQNEGMGTGAVKVTRWKWVHSNSPAELKASPAVGVKGTVYVGTKLGGNGELVALNPEGTVKWRKAVGAVEGSPSVGRADGGEDVIFVAAETATEAVLFSLDEAGGTRHSCSVAPGSSSKVSLGIAAMSVGGETQLSALGLVNVGAAGRLVAVRPDATITAERCVVGSPNKPAEFPATVSIRQAHAYYGDNEGNVQGVELQQTFPNRANWPVAANLFTRGLAFSGANLVGGGGGPGQGGVFRIPLEVATPTVAWKHPMGASSPAWSPSIGQGDAIYFGNQMPVLTRVFLEATQASASVTTSGTVRAAPTLGNDQSVYAPDTSGALTAYSETLDVLWELSGLGAIEASPNLDCARDTNGAKVAGRPGVLYVASDNGSLYAIVVDSKGIDTSAPWPKYQHDPRNTGNSSTDLSEFACP